MKKLAYTALYRKFRPLKFEDMVGEDHITTTLKNQIMANRVGHAYLFNGGRGTGKTTSAKILARAVNCLNPQNGEPCNECEICKEILDGSLTDVVEMDAASNNSVEDIRSIREEVNFLPTKAKYRVYIIDEVHMLTTGAFNALLKTLEEPPEHVKFILATTEPQKLPTTILSRCQRFDFKKITNENIVKRLKIICQESSIKITAEALELIAVLSEGAMRDGISILERCCQENADEIDVNLVKELVGIPSLEYISAITRAILENDELKALETIDAVMDSGKDLNNFLWEVIKYIKDVLIVKASGNVSIYSKDEVKVMKEIAALASREKILKIIYTLSEIENDMKWSNQKTIMFQVGIIKACHEGEMENVLQIEPKEEKKIQREEPKSVAKQETKKEESKKEESKKEEPPKEKMIQKSESTDVNWKNVINALKASGKVRLYTSLVNTVIRQQGDMILEIIFPNGLTPFIKGLLEESSNKKDLTDVLVKETGKQWHIKLVDGKQGNTSTKKTTKAKTDSMNDLGIEIHVIE